MNTILATTAVLMTSTSIASNSIMADPVITRDEATVIRIDGADYAFITPSPSGVVHGIPIMYEIAWADESDGGIEFVVDSNTEYTVNSFIMDESAPNGRIHHETVFAPPGELTIEEQLDEFIRERMAMEEALSDFVSTNNLNFFDISAAIQRVTSELD